MAQHAMHGAADCDNAARARRSFARMQLPADDRPDAVGANEHIAFGGAAVSEVQCDAAARNGEARRFRVGGDRFQPNGVEKSTVQGGAQRDYKWTAENAARNLGAFQDSTIHAPQLGASRLEAACHDDVTDSQLAERSNRVRRQPDAEPELARRGGTLEDADIPTGPAQCDRRRETADARSDDEGASSHANSQPDLAVYFLLGSSAGFT
jgi:hypothetical protein